MNFIVRLLLISLAVVLAAYILPGVHIKEESFFYAILVGAILAFLNATLKPALVILTIPITVFTLGLFLLVINAFIIMLADFLLDGFRVDGFWWAVLFSLVVSIFTSVFESLAGTKRNRNY